MKLILNDREIPYKNLKNNTFSEDEKYNSEFEKRLFAFVKEYLNDDEFVTARTSGSTGKPKVLKLLKKNMKNSAEQTRAFFEPWNKDPLMLCLDTSFIAGKMMVVRALEYNLPLICTNPASTPLKNLNRNVQFTAMVPAQVEQSLSDLHKSQKIIIGGAPVSRELEEKLQDTSAQCFATYGMTETITHIAVKPLNGLHRLDYYTLLPGVTGSISKENTLVIDAPHLGVSKLKTNDIVELKGNKFKWLGRSDFIINSGGLKINPAEIEELLAQQLDFPFFSWSEPDPILGKRHILVVQAEKTKTVIAQIEHTVNSCINDRKKHPKKICFTNQLQYTLTGKLNRRESFNSCNEQVTISN